MTHKVSNPASNLTSPFNVLVNSHIFSWMNQDIYLDFAYSCYSMVSKISVMLFSGY